MNFLLPLCCAVALMGGWRIQQRQKLGWALLLSSLIVAALFGCSPIHAQTPASTVTVKYISPPSATAPSAIQPAASPQPGASVTDKHPYAVYFILIAASLAAMASLASSSLTAWVAWKSKDKEYRNDYYKKVIDKRMKAIEAAEEMLSLLSLFKEAGDGSGLYHEFFENEAGNEPLTSATKKFGTLTTWANRELVIVLRELVDIVSAVSIEADRLDRTEHQSVYVRRFPIVNAKLLDIQYLIGLEMEQLHDVKGFFKTRYSQFKPNA